MPPTMWQLIDEMRGSSSRGVFISVCVYRQISARLTTTDVLQSSHQAGSSSKASLPPPSWLYATFRRKMPVGTSGSFSGSNSKIISPFSYLYNYVARLRSNHDYARDDPV